MFEKAKPVFYAHNARFAGGAPPKSAAQSAIPAGVAMTEAAMPVTAADPFGAEDGELRAMDWSELSARLSAARDLRRVLHREAGRKFASQTGGFAEAAARYFRAKDNNEQGVNLVALEQSKGSSCMSNLTQTHAAEAMRETR